MQSRERKRNLGLLAAVGGVLLAIACGGGGAGGGTAYGSGPSATSTPAPTAGAPADVTITINSMSGAQSFSPSPGSVKVGQTVAWRNADSIAHRPNGSGFDAGSISPGATSAPVTFSAAGDVAYFCAVHPSMVGTLNVTQ